jgi:ABC-type branched-subunit amino acid transport system ATPase component/ABC-type branched-subunit amino acid transport system permease subunit
VVATAFFSEQSLKFAIFGISTGSLVALVALGLVLTYRASGVLNFAAAATGAMGAFLFYDLRDSYGWPTIPALILGLGLGALMGAVTQGLLALLRQSSVMAKLIATLGLLISIQGFIAVVWGVEGQPDSILSTENVNLWGDFFIPRERLIHIGLVIVFAIVLRLVYSKTKFGLATSAVSENRRVAASSGWSPNRIEFINFTLAGVLSAAAAILVAPIVGLNGVALSLLVIPALAAALVGGFSSFALTVGAAFLIGIGQTELQLFQIDIASKLGIDPTSITGLPRVVPLLIVVIVTVAAGRSRPSRGEAGAKFPGPGSGQVSPVLIGVGVAVSLFILLAADDSWATALMATFGTAILLLSIVVVTGYGGQLSLCQFALAGMGAWFTSRLMVDHGIPFELAALLGVVLTVPVGFLVALPALRTRGVNLAIVTLALAEMINALVFNNGSLTGGFGGTIVAPPKFLGINIDPISEPQRYTVFVMVVFVVCGLVTANIRRGSSGRRLLACRSNERAAAALGINVYGAKLYAFGVASAIAALAGITLAFRNQNIQFLQFDVLGSITAVLYAIIGGIGWASGAVAGSTFAVGSVVAKVTQSLFVNLGEIAAWLSVLSGVIVFQILAFSPDGIVAQISRGLGARIPFPRIGARREIDTTEAGDASARVTRPPCEIQVEGLTVRFGGVVALDSVGFTIHSGEVLGLIGPNGAGKTTLLDVVTGFTPLFSGSVKVNGEAIDKLTPEKRARRGIARSWQAVELFDELSIRENLLVGADTHSAYRYLTDLVRPGRTVENKVFREVVEEFGLEEYLDVRPSELPQGPARLAGIARAVVSEPTALLLDEPAAGLDGRESQELGAAIRRICDRRGIGVLLVEHDVELVVSVCDRIVVLDFGRKIAEGTPDEIVNNVEVIRAYLGGGDEPDAAVAGSVEMPL